MLNTRSVVPFLVGVAVGMYVVPMVRARLGGA